MTQPIDPAIISRAQGCLLGQLAGDALGSLVEFLSPAEIRRRYPDGVRDMADGGTWDTIAGQPTDDSEMALALARTLLESGTYDRDAVRAAYVQWMRSGPFDMGGTVRSGLEGRHHPHSRANGALMRISPLGIFCWSRDDATTAAWADDDAALTHPDEVCRQINILFTQAVAMAVRTGLRGDDLATFIEGRATAMNAHPIVNDCISNARLGIRPNLTEQQGYVANAFTNALYFVWNDTPLEEAVIETVMAGGDTDTNAAICGALLGAAQGRDAVPERWRSILRNCRPDASRRGVRHPRPALYWPVDVEELAGKLVER